MTSLVAKDLRISLDAVLPLAMVIAGLLLVALLATLVPNGAGPAFLSGVTFRVAVQYFSALLLAGSFVVAAWVTASVLLGDASHRAAALAASMPVGARTRSVSKLTAIVLSVGGVLGLAWVAHQRTSEAGAPIFFVSRTTVSAGYWISTAFAGAALAGITARLCGAVWRTVATTLASATVIGVVALLGAWGGYAWALAPLAGNALRESYPLPLNPWEISAAWTVAVASGLTGGFCISTVVVVLLHWCIRRRTWRVVAGIGLCASLGAAVGGSSAAFVGVRGDRAIAEAVDDAKHIQSFAAMSDADLLGSVAIYLESHHGLMDWRARQRGESDVSAALARMSAMSDVEFDASPFARGLVTLAAATGDNARQLAWNMTYLPGERGLGLALRLLYGRSDAVEPLHWRLLRDEVERGFMTDAEMNGRFNWPDELASVGRWRTERVIELLDAAIERGHPLRVELESARDFLRAKLPSMPPDVVRTSPLPTPSDPNGAQP